MMFKIYCVHTYSLYTKYFFIEILGLILPDSSLYMYASALEGSLHMLYKVGAPILVIILLMSEKISCYLSAAHLLTEQA